MLRRLCQLPVLLCLATLLLYGVAGAQDLLKDRARWEYTDPKTKTKHTLTGWVTFELTVGPGATVKDRKQIGTWKSIGPDEIQLNVTDESHRLAGTIVVKKTKAKTPTYAGDRDHNGNKEKVVFKLFKD